MISIIKNWMRNRRWNKLVDRVRKLPPMTPEEREEQRRSFAYGNVKLSNPDVTREMVDKVADAMNLEANIEAARAAYGRRAESKVKAYEAFLKGATQPDETPTPALLDDEVRYPYHKKVVDLADDLIHLLDVCVTDLGERDDLIFKAAERIQQGRIDRRSRIVGDSNDATVYWFSSPGRFVSLSFEQGCELTVLMRSDRKKMTMPDVREVHADDLAMELTRAWAWLTSEEK